MLDILLVHNSVPHYVVGVRIGNVLLEFIGVWCVPIQRCDRYLDMINPISLRWDDYPHRVSDIAKHAAEFFCSNCSFHDLRFPIGFRSGYLVLIRVVQCY